jgi:hypothetical protein
MYFERLVLEIQSNNAGWKTVKPPFVDGISGIAHKFSFLATDEACTYGFDIYNDVSEEEVLRTYMKRMDTKALAVIVSLSGRPKMEVARLADQYGITILGPGDIEQFFSMDSIEQWSAQRPLAKVSD